MPKRRTANTTRKPAQASHRRFADEYLGNGFNATQAYKHAYPNATHESAMRLGSRLLRDVEVAAYLSTRMEQVLAAQQMTGSEALVRLARLARGDMRDVFDDKGQALEPHQWPEGYGSCVRAFHWTPDGIKVTLWIPSRHFVRSLK